MGISALVGSPIKRREDPRLITGQGNYVDDIKLVGMLHMSVLRSPYGHARINSINTDEARKLPGVVAVYTAQDLKGSVGNIPIAAPLPGNISNGMGRRGPLADGKVRFYGDPVAIVLADDRYTARDARDLIEVDYEPLPAVVDTEKAMQSDAPLLYEDFETNVGMSITPPTDDIDKIFEQTKADGGIIVKQRIYNQRLAPASMETRGAVAEFRRSDRRLTLWSSSQIPHLLRNFLSQQLGLPQHQVHVIVPDVGGAFGSKLNIYAEEALVAFAAMKTKRPVKWIEDRSENLAATIHGRDQVDYVEVAATKDGKVKGLKVHVISDLGAHLQFFTDVIAIAFTLPMLSGCYDIPAIYSSCDIVFTNKAPTDAYRGAGRPEAAFLIERAMDLVARELGKDPSEVRRINFVQPDQFPHKMATGAVYDTGNYEGALDKAMQIIDYQNLRAEQAQKRAEGKLMGIGFSTYAEICALGPKGSVPFGFFEGARVSVDEDGSVMVYSGSCPHGQGEETTFAQIAAEEFSISVENVSVLFGDTDSTPEGRGTYGSRTTSVGGTAVYNAVQKIKEKMQLIASHMLEANLSDIALEDGKFSVAGTPQKSVTFNEVAANANTSNALQAGVEPGLEVVSFFEPEGHVFPFGTHICVVEIDKETGEVEITRYVAVDDCGRQLNPMIVEGQIHGGIVQGVGQAMWEEVVYGEDGQLLTGTFMDYAMPVAEELPPFELDHTVTLTPVNPLGVKGVGEAGTIGSTPAVAAAVADALGVAHVDMPMKSEKMWQLISNQSQQSQQPQQSQQSQGQSQPQQHYGEENV